MNSEERKRILNDLHRVGTVLSANCRGVGDEEAYIISHLINFVSKIAISNGGNAGISTPAPGNAFNNSYGGPLKASDMTLEDKFAIEIMKITLHGEVNINNPHARKDAKQIYAIAREMMKARSEKNDYE